MRAGRRLALGACLVLAAACTNDVSDNRIREEVQALAQIEGVGLTEALARVAGHGRRAIPHIELALHDAKVIGRLNLIAALRRVHDVEAIPLLGHRTLHDEDERVRTEAEWTLRQWAGEPGSLADAARKELRAIEEARGDVQHG